MLDGTNQGTCNIPGILGAPFDKFILLVFILLLHTFLTYNYIQLKYRSKFAIKHFGEIDDDKGLNVTKEN